MLGDKAPLLQRSASWRALEASANQQKTLSSLRSKEDQNSPQVPLSLSGEVSDAIAQERFIKRVRPEML